MPDKFNEKVECDLFFVFGKIVFSMVCVCIRWLHTTEIPNKEEDSIITAIDTWCAIHGPMKQIVMDSETAVYRSKKTQQYLVRKSIEYIPRAKGQQIATIDRRLALQREAIHKAVEQLKVEGMKIPFLQVLNDTTFASNILLSVNGMSPYMALYGRVPALLPPPTMSEAENENILGAPGTIRHSLRLREIVTEAMVQATAAMRAQRAMQTRTLSAGQSREYKTHDLVDFYRPPNNKDICGWMGPAKVVDNSHPEHGTITIRHANVPFECRFQDIRAHIPYLVFLAQGFSAYGNYVQAWNHLKLAVDMLSRGSAVLLGMIKQDKWLPAKENAKWSEWLENAIAFAETSLAQEHVVAVRFANGCAKLGPLKGYSFSITLWWMQSTHHIHEVESVMEDESGTISGINFQKMCPESWQGIKAIQFLYASEQDC